VAASGLAAFLVPWLGWRATCQLFALTGVIWAIEFWLTFRDRPEQHPWVNKEEISLIRGMSKVQIGLGDELDVPAAEAKPAILSGLAVYGTLAFWMLTGQGICRTFCYNFLTSWFPTFLERSHGVQLRSAGLMTMVPLAGVVTGALGGGAIIDGLLRATGSKWLSRCGVGAAGLAIAAMGSLAAMFVTGAGAALCVLALGAASLGLAAPATWAATMDIGGSRSAASVMALANMAGNLAAFLCPIAVGAILDHTEGNWTLVLAMLTAVALCGAVCWIFVNPDPSPLRSRPD
jgi:nitrate/nitrite transporter NarK